MLKYSYLIVIVILFNMCSNKSNLKEEKSIQNYISSNFKSYSGIHDTIGNIIESNIKLKLKSYFFLISKTGYKVDDLIILNENKTKLFSTLNSINSIQASGSSDLIQSLYGVKIDGEWHIYLGAQNLIAMRDGYKYDKYEPFTWDEISYVAHEQMFGRYLNFKNGELSINEKQIEADTGIKALTGKNPDEVPSAEFAFKELTDYYNSRKIDSIEYQQLLDEVNNPEPKVKEPIKKITWWDKLFGAKEPIFETDEWKENIKKKSEQ